ncbi:MAG: hypothetical protein P1U61_03875 [Legionellaceae bacterium]|nr:hypothetical protein [Legionellaceae bacterium]
MALSEKITTRSFEALRDKYPEKLRNVHYQNLLEAVNKVAASNDVPLDAQSVSVTTELFRQLNLYANAEANSEINIEALSLQIFNELEVLSQKDTEQNHLTHQNNSGFSRKYIHERSKREQLEDHDMMALMPESTQHVEVLAQLKRDTSESFEAVREGVRTALQNKTIQHIMLAVGPGHWRGLYLSKPLGPDEKYQLDIFDPFGPSGGKCLERYAKDFFCSAGIKSEDIVVHFSGPAHPQRDLYACGDFTCAYSHQMMKKFGVLETGYHQSFIDVLEQDGNKNDVLRNMSRSICAARYAQSLDLELDFNADLDEHSIREKNSLKKKRRKVNIQAESQLSKRAAKVSEKNGDEFDWIFLFKCCSYLAMLAGGAMFLLGLLLPISSLAFGGVCVFSLGFFAYNQLPVEKTQKPAFSF